MTSWDRRHLAVGCCALAAGLARPCAAQTDDPPTFDQVPLISTQSPRVFAGVFGGAFGGARRALMLGDSQETCPGGAGDVYVPRFNYEFWRRYRNCPETPWTSTFVSYGGGQPWGHWLLRAAYAPPCVTTTRLAPGRMPPGMPGCKTSTRGAPNVNDNQQFGQLFMLQPDAACVNPAAEVSGGGPYFDTSGGVYLDVIAATNESSGGVSVRVEPTTTTASPTFNAPVTAVLSHPMGLESPDQEIHVHRFGPLPFGPRPVMQVEIAGTDPNKFTDVLAARFVGAADLRGLTVSTASDGGYFAAGILQRQPACGPVLAAMAPDVVFLCYGANDFSVPRSIEQYRQDVVDLIAYLRQEISPTLPVVLLADPARTPLPASWQDRFDRVAGANQRVADADPLVCAVNSRLLLDQLGWTTATADQFLADTVHYNPKGAALKAAAEVDLLVRTFCPSDFNGDGFTDFFDYDSFVECFETGVCPPGADPDITGDGFLDFFDYDLFVTFYETGCAPAGG